MINAMKIVQGMCMASQCNVKKKLLKLWRIIFVVIVIIEYRFCNIWKKKSL